MTKQYTNGDIILNNKISENDYDTFLKHLAEYGNIKKAAELSNISYSAIFRYRKKNKKFNKEMESALESAAVLLEDEAKRRAIEGIEEPIFYKGQSTGSKIKYSDKLLITLLKAHYPEKYAEKTIVATVEIIVVTIL